MEQIYFHHYKVECSQKGDLHHTTQRVELKYRGNPLTGERIVDRFTCGFYNGSDECVMCKARILEIFNRHSCVPEGKVIASDQTFEDFPPIV